MRGFAQKDCGGELRRVDSLEEVERIADEAARMTMKMFGIEPPEHTNGPAKLIDTNTGKEIQYR